MKGLRVPIQDIPQEGLTVNFGEKSSHLELEGEDSSWISPVKGSCLLQRFDSAVLCRGKLQATLIMECGRCLQKFHHPLEVGFAVTFQAKVSPPTEEELELEAQDFDTYSYETGEIDLKEAIRDHLGSAVPLQPLCRTDCAGLCPQCGRDLNKGLCQCPPQEGDPRWAALAHLKGVGGSPERKDAATKA